MRVSGDISFCNVHAEPALRSYCIPRDYSYAVSVANLYFNISSLLLFYSQSALCSLAVHLKVLLLQHLIPSEFPITRYFVS